MPTKIQWTDETWSPVCGCTKIAAGCKNCYAELSKPAVCETINVFDIDMTLEQVLQNVLVNIQEYEKRQERGGGTSRYLGYAERYCQAAYEFARTKSAKPAEIIYVCPHCKKTLKDPTLPHSCERQPVCGDEAIKEAMEAVEQRKQGRYKLVYDKASRTIVAVPNPNYLPDCKPPTGQPAAGEFTNKTLKKIATKLCAICPVREKDESPYFKDRACFDKHYPSNQNCITLIELACVQNHIDGLEAEKVAIKQSEAQQYNTARMAFHEAAEAKEALRVLRKEFVELVELKEENKRLKEKLEWILTESKTRDAIALSTRLDRIQTVADKALQGQKGE